MHSSAPDLTRAESLRILRESQNIGVVELAKHVNLSPAQILQLESGVLAAGQRSLFYTPAIEEKAAIRIAQKLGADPQSLWGGVVDPASAKKPGKPDLQLVDALAALLKKQAMAQAMDASDRSFSWKWLFISLMALWVAGSVGFYGQQVLEWVHRQAVQDAAPIVLAPVSTEQTASLATPELPGVSPMTLTTFTQAQHTLTDKSLAGTLCDSHAPQTTLRVGQPTKTGNSLHVVAMADLVICARDGLGKQTALKLKAQESRTLWGKAPWSLHVENPSPSDLHMFFQGNKVHWPEGAVHGVILKEVPGDF
jgi:transcriptional regulator with XRE-family HTH domain